MVPSGRLVPGAGSGQGVLQEHRDGQRPDTAGNRRERAGRLRHRGVNVADDQRAAAGEIGEARRARRRTAAWPTASSVSREMPTSMTVAPGRTKSVVTKPGTADRRDQDVGRGAQRGEVRRLRVRRSSPSRRAGAAAWPSACRRSRCARRSPRACPAMGMPLRSSISITPDGVHGASTARPCTSRPTFTGLKPSTSLRRVDRVEHLLRRALPHRRRQRRLDEYAVVPLAGVEASARARAARQSWRSPAAVAGRPTAPTRCPHAPCCARRSPSPDRRRRARCPAPAGVPPPR